MYEIPNIKEDWNNKVPQFKEKVSRVLNSDYLAPVNAANPYTDRDGNLVNPYLNYQELLDSDSTSTKVKSFIQQATGLTPTPKVETSTPGLSMTSPVGSTLTVNPTKTPTSPTNYKPSGGGGDYAKLVGTRIANTGKYKIDSPIGQCVWYVRGRAKEKLGIDLAKMGHGNQMYTNAKSEAKLAATKDNIKPNMLVSYGKGTSTAGQTYGHVIFVEDVVGDTVYYTEGGSGYYKNGKDGVVKTTTKQGLLDGVNSNGKRIGSEIKGFVDLDKYK